MAGPINKTVRGIRDSIPAGYFLGRTGTGNGPPILLPLSMFTTPGFVANTTIPVGLPSADILVGNAGGVATPVALSGDATLANTGALTLASVIAAAGPVGDAAHTPVLTYDAKGRLTVVTNTAIAIAAGAVSGLASVATSGSASDLGSGTLPDARLSNTITAAGPIGDATHVAAITYDAHGRLTTVSSIAITQPVGANPTATAGPTAVNGSASTFMRSDGAPAVQKASSSQFGIVEVDGTTITATAGVITAVGSVVGANPTATIGASAVNGVATTYLRSDGAPALPATLPALSGVNLTALNASNLGSGTVPDAQLSNTITAAGPVGDAAHTPVLTYDAKGRLTTVTNTAIAIAAGAVSGLAAVATSGSASDLGSGTLPDARLSNTIAAAGPIGDGTHVAAITFDAHGRLTTVSSVAITAATGANPTATIGSAAVNGTATTFMRSDAAPALPATLPALSGVNLTALNGSNITSGTVAAARIADLSSSYLPLAGGTTTGPVILQGTVKIQKTGAFGVSGAGGLYVQDAAHPTFATIIGYDYAAGFGFIQARDEGTADKTLVLNPDGGIVKVAAGGFRVEKTGAFGTSGQGAIYAADAASPLYATLIGYDTAAGFGYIQAREEGIADETLVLNPDGGVTQVGPGGLRFGSSGAILNDYETGTWTPADASGAGLTLTVNIATYMRLGKTLFISVSVSYPVTANASTAVIGGLPYGPPSGNPTGAASGGSGNYVEVLISVTTMLFLLATGNFAKNSDLSGKVVTANFFFTTS